MKLGFWLVFVVIFLPIAIKLFLTYVLYRWIEERYFRRMEQIFRDAQYDRDYQDYQEYQDYQDYDERVRNFYKDNNDKTD